MDEPSSEFIRKLTVDGLNCFIVVVCIYTCKGQKTTVPSGLSFHLFSASGLELRSPCLCSSHLYPLNHLTISLFYFISVAINLLLCLTYKLDFIVDTYVYRI